jgi:hypothetical protein
VAQLSATFCNLWFASTSSCHSLKLEEQEPVRDMTGSSRGEEPSMDLFINHPIFAETSAAAADNQSAPSQSPPKPQGLQNSLCIRDTDVIVAVGGELRMMPTPSQSSGRFAYKVSQSSRHKPAV